jgi:4-diphosphocytidyl-2-C-methyl-D-erythritol kinase
VLYRSFAKVNLTLEVLGKRSDGFHDLASLVHTISLADDLRIEPADDILSRVEGLDIDAERNLVSRAARLFALRSRVRLGAQLTLIKRIPAAAGLGGGSSDAATTLIGLNELWGTRLSISDLTALAAELGSDVPFFVRGGAALMQGRGDNLQTLQPLGSQWLVLVVPSHAVVDKTARLYAALEPCDYSRGDITLEAAERLEQRLPLLEAQLTNAFTRAARSVFPGLSAQWAEIEAACERRFFLSGAGPTLFALASDRVDARRVQAQLVRRGLAAHAVRTVGHARVSPKFARRSGIRYA